MNLECLVDGRKDIWRHDPALERARAAVERLQGRIRVVSLDFFDTLVWRWTEEPSGVFTEVGHRLKGRGLLPEHWRPEDYRAYRRMAEVRARDALMSEDKSREDVTLEEILQNLRPLGVDPVRAAEVEVEAEQDLCCLNPAMVQFACWLRERGVRVLVVSDVYLSAAHLASILRANQCDPDLFHRIYTSADHGVCKATGNLFRAVLRAEGFSAEEWLHVGDSLHADVLGAWKAGIQTVPYTAVWPVAPVIVARETFLPGRRPTVFSARWLRLLAARRYEGQDEANFFRRAGALLVGPVLSGFAEWACEQFVRAGVRRVGAFMREGALLGKMLEREAARRGIALEGQPLYVNRTSTDLAAVGRLTAEKLVDWLGRRQTLSVQEICGQLGLERRDLRGVPVAPENKLETKEQILELARWLFRPQNLRRIEARSREERRKVVDYLRPWLANGGVFGVCDIGYNATAQYQIHEILRLEGLSARVVGCYVLGCEVAALRALDGLDVRTYLGSFGQPGLLFWAFLRSPAFVEQLINASCGTTLGYERLSDGSVKPVLAQTPLPAGLAERQGWFQEGVLWYQTLWLWVRRLKGERWARQAGLEQRLDSDLQIEHASAWVRAAAFPTSEEIEHFGQLVLDDRYLQGGVRTLCGSEQQEMLRSRGYVELVRQQDVLWPQGVHRREYPKAADNWFHYGRAMLTGSGDTAADDARVRISVFVPVTGSPESLPPCLERLRTAWPQSQELEVILLTDLNQGWINSEVRKALRGLRYRCVEVDEQRWAAEQWQQWLVESRGAWVLWIRPDVVLPPGGLARMGKSLENGKVGAVLPMWPDTGNVSEGQPGHHSHAVSRCFLMTRLALEEVGHRVKASNWADMCLELLAAMEDSGWGVLAVPEVCAGTDGRLDGRLRSNPADQASRADCLGKWEARAARWWGKMEDLAKQEVHPGESSQLATGSTTGGAGARLVVDWIGSFLDHGSLSHVNRELTLALRRSANLVVRPVHNGAPAAPGYTAWRSRVCAAPSAEATVTVRHAWPPDWRRPARGRLVVIQPWEFGALPLDWVRAADRVDEFWVPSHYVREVYVGSGVPAEKVVVIPNGIDPARFHPEVPPRALPTRKRFRFLFVGGTIPRKGPDVLLRAYLATFTGSDDVCLVIKDCGGRTHYAGQTLADQIRACQRRPGSPEIVYLDEEWDPAELPGLYTACQCLVLPYRGEGFGLPVLEAMACGVPVIVTAGGATEDFVAEGCGWRIPAERHGLGERIGEIRLARPGWWLEPDARALGDLMRRAYEGPDVCRERGRRAADHARAHFTWAKAAEKVSGRLEALMAGRVEGRTVTGRTDLGPASRPSRPGGQVVLPACARLGHLGRARELQGRRQWPVSWQATVEAIRERPFHPEAWLLLAEIAEAVGAGGVARECAQRARRMAPGYAPARQFLKRSFKGTARPGWMRWPGEAEEVKEGAGPRLTVCLITKDEESFLGQCLASVREVADQIVVVDTGSTDRTVEIARAHGAEVYHLEWCDDFSAARNAALEHARGDWILMLDADEELTEEGRRELVAALRAEEVIAWRLPLVDVGREAQGPSFVPRLFRNAPGLFYVGRVHEQVFSSIEVRRRQWGLDCRIGKVLLRHHGYRPEVIRDRRKVERNLRLLERAVEEMPGEPHLLMNYGLELARSGREAEALEQYRAAFVALSRKPAGEVVPELREMLLTQFASRLFAAGRFDEVIEVLNSPLAKGHGGLTASLHFSLGLALLERGQFHEAAEQMRQCLAKRDRPALGPILPEIRTAAPHHCMALALWRGGQLQEARKSFEAALAAPGAADRVWLDYARFLVDQKELVEALRVLTACVTANAACVEAWRLGGQIALSRAEFLEFARDWTGEAMRYQAADEVIRQQRATALLLSGDCGGALAVWEELERENPQAEIVAAARICAVVCGRELVPWESGESESSVSRAWLLWYRRLHRAGAHAVLLRVHETLPVWAGHLPTAARCLEAALAEASRETNVTVQA